MSVRDAIVALLDEQRLRRIDFSMDGSAIGRSGFAQVRAAIESERIGVVVDPAMPAGAGARYNDEANQIGHEPGLTPDQIAASFSKRALLLHECTHALVDINRVSLRVLADEAAGYIVQLMYRLLAGDRTIRAWAESHQGRSTGRIFHQSIEVIDRFHLLDRHAELQSQRDCPELLAAIQGHPVYRGTRATDHSLCNAL